jgi:hypothetical protein
MTITAAVETEGYQLYIKEYLGENKRHRAKPVGTQMVFDDDQFHSVAAAPSEHPPHPGGYVENMQNSVIVQGFKEKGKYGGVVDGVQIGPTKTKIVKGIIFEAA